PAVIYSAEEKTRIIQQTLTEQGYSLKVDGKFGAQTRGAAVNYLATKGILVANDIALDPLFEYFKPNVKTP
ncbi:peptidoglycan-binding domain-containing protein, partial [[Pasteurella] aerogenes]